MPYAVPINILADFQQKLVGRWENRDFGVDQHGNPIGGPENPLSYNIMPLPQQNDPDGYILKNFRYSERLKFNDDNVDDTLAVAAEAPNRGGEVSQNARALFYEQQVRFAEGPAKSKVVHVENGAWLYLPRYVQQDGPYPPDIDQELVSNALQQPSDVVIAKQISIPHGNSILALGSFQTVAQETGDDVFEKRTVIKGAPVIPDAPFPYPIPAIPMQNPMPPPTLKSLLNIDARYTTKRDTMADFQNPHPDLTQWPNRPLQRAVAIIQPTAYMHWHVTTQPQQDGRGHVTNIPFERRVSNVTEYLADYWLLFREDGEAVKRYLAYTQTILMTLTIGERHYCFPHVTCNTVTYCP